MKTKKSNKQVVLAIDTDVEGDDNRGWQVDKITASIDNNEVGYLKFAYIPKHRFVEYYPTVFNFMDQIKGQFILPRPDRNDCSDDEWRASSKRHYKTLNEEELRKMLNRLALHNRGGDISRELESLDHTELMTRVKEEEKNYLAGYMGKEFKRFKTYYVDKPIDDFIRVEAEHQREGIAEHLYKVGVKWMESRDLPFYLSTLRQPAAEALADKFRNNGMIRRMSNKRERFIPEKVVV